MHKYIYTYKHSGMHAHIHTHAHSNSIFPFNAFINDKKNNMESGDDISAYNSYSLSLK